LSPATPWSRPRTTRTRRASHLYQPELRLRRFAASAEPGASAEPADPESSEAIAEDDPAWDVAQQQAEQTAGELRAITDVAARMEAFASRAAADGTDATAQTGGDLGFFERGDMVPEFADPIFDAEDPQQGDIIGPVRSQFGWHVIMYDEARGPLAERLAAVQAALAAEDADFAPVATELSDGPEAADGGETGWHAVEDLDQITALALSAIDVGEVTEPIDGQRGYTIYQKQDEATQPLEPAAAAAKARTAFTDWYQEQRFEAEDAGDITIADSVFEE
jgi:parvulin-like peptidyl-prolyl isomerase